MGLKERAARRRLKKLVPTREPYLELEQVVWPYRTVGLWPNVSLPEVVLDSRGHRLSRHGEDTVASDNAPADAAFLIGGSYAFGVGASSDAGTLASALWRRSGTPYVNLGLPAETSTQELIWALALAERTARFVLVSGINNLTAATGAPLDPLFGPS